MTREELLAQARWCDEAREEIADWAGFASEYFQDKYDLVEVLAKWQVRARELRAQAEAMPAREPVAWTISELCRFFAYAYRAGHQDTCEAVYTHVLECDADTYHQDSVVEYLTDNGMNAAPPDLAARVRELEALLRCVHPGANGPECCDIEGTNWFDARDAALAKGVV